MSQARPNTFRAGPDEHGKFGVFGGRYVAETLMPLVLDVEKAYHAAKTDPAFKARMDDLAKHYIGRPSPLYFAERLTEHLGGAKIYLKREDLQEVRSFKLRGAYNKIASLTADEKSRGIVCASAGNHAQGVAYSCSALQI